MRREEFFFFLGGGGDFSMVIIIIQIGIGSGEVCTLHLYFGFCVPVVVLCNCSPCLKVLFIRLIIAWLVVVAVTGVKDLPWSVSIHSSFLRVHLCVLPLQSKTKEMLGGGGGHHHIHQHYIVIVVERNPV